MTTVRTYRSTDASAPTLTGQVGSLLTLLDACLVNGYGALAAAGWTKPFANSSNVGCYQNSATDGTGFCLSVNDNGPGTGGAREARMTGFQTLSAVATGTGQFPTSGQLAIGTGAVVCRKSNTADTTARAWTVVADDTVFYLFTETGDFSSPTQASGFVFGDIFSYKSSDPYRCIIIGRNNETSGANGQLDCLTPYIGGNTFTLAMTISGHFMAATWTGVGGSLLVGKHTDMYKIGPSNNASSNTSTGTGSPYNISTNEIYGIGVNSTAPSNFPFPNGPDGGLFLAPIWIHHNGSVRGYLKGLWSPLHDRPLNHNDTYSGTGNMSGKSFLVQNLQTNSSGQTPARWGQPHIETSSTWS